MSSLSGNAQIYYKTLNGLQSLSADSIYTGMVTADDGNFDNLQVNISSTLDGSTTIQNGLININTPHSLSVNSGVVIDGSKNCNMNSYAINSTSVIDSSKNCDMNSYAINGSIVVDSAKNCDMNSYEINGSVICDQNKDATFNTIDINTTEIVSSGRRCTFTQYRHNQGVTNTDIIDTGRNILNINNCTIDGSFQAGMFVFTPLFKVDNSADRVFIKTTSGSADLNVNTDIQAGGNITASLILNGGNLNIDSGLLQTDATNNYVLINNPTVVSGYNTQISGDTLITQGGLQINGFLNANSRDSIKTETMRPGIFYRVARLNTTASTTTQICVNVNRDTGTVAKDDNTYSAHNLQFNEDGSSNYQSHIGSGGISLVNRYGVDTSGNFRLPDSGNTYRYPAISNSADQLIQSGIETTNSSTGTITFSLAFTASPVITATMVNSSTSTTLNCFVVTIHTVTTTSFQYVKKYVDFGTNTCGDAVSEDFHWIAIGTK